MDCSDGWNVMEKQKKPVLSKALHCVRVKRSVLGRRTPLQKWLTAFSTKASFPKHTRQANLINRVRGPSTPVPNYLRTVACASQQSIALTVCVSKPSSSASCQNRKWANRKLLYWCALTGILFLFPQFRKQGYEGCDPWQDTLPCYTVFITSTWNYSQLISQN